MKNQVIEGLTNDQSDAIDKLLKEIEELKSGKEIWRNATIRAESERDAYKSKLEALRQITAAI
jgi:hypothetical protein